MITIYNNTGTPGGGNPPIYYDVMVNFWAIDQMLDTGEWVTALPQTPLTVQRSSDNGYLLLLRETLSPDDVFAYYVSKDDSVKIEPGPVVQDQWGGRYPNLKTLRRN